MHHISFHNFYLINIVLSLVLIFEILKFFKKDQILKLQFIGLLTSLFVLNLYLFDFYKYSFGFVLHLLGIFGIITCLINIVIILYQYKLNKQFNYIVLVLFFASLSILFFRFYTHQPILDSDLAPFLTNEHKGLSVIKLIIQLLVCVSFLYICVKIFKKTDDEFYYHRVLRKWLFIFLIIISLISFFSLSLFVDYFYPLNISYILNINFGLFAQESFYLFVLFRPKYLDAEEIKYSLPYIMDLSTKKELKEIFNNLFFIKKYYLNPNASLAELASLINVERDELHDYLKLEQHQNFIELLNNKRLDHFISLLEQGKHTEFTIEALSFQSGFGTRQSLYQTFRKVKGCSPSDYILRITK